MTADADRHLLLGLLALQNGLINQGQLVAAFQAWTLEKSQSLASHLEARGDLTGTKRALLEALAQVHLDTHGGDVQKSIAAVSAGSQRRKASLGSATRTSTRRSTTSAWHMTDRGRRFRPHIILRCRIGHQRRPSFPRTPAACSRWPRARFSSRSMPS